MSKHSGNLSLKNLFDVYSSAYLIAGVTCAVVALKGFMIPNAFLDGGVTGISLLIHEIYHINFGILLLAFNLVFIVLIYKHVDRVMAIRSFMAILLLAALTEIIPVPVVTSDKLLIAVFGGCLIGLGMGLVARAHAVIDGFEVLALFTRRKIAFSVSEVILTFNSILFFLAAIEFGIETAMYSIITYFTALKTLEYVIDGIEEYIALTIISRESESIKSAIGHKFGKGITVYKGERGYLPDHFEVHTDCDIIVTIVTRFELLQIKSAVEKTDPVAFMYTHSIKEARGGILKRKVSH